MALVLHGYWRSGPSYRVRIGLHLKGVAFAQAPVNILRGEHLEPAYAALNPQRLVPMLEAEGHRLTQSPAILEWLEETYPEPRLLPGGAFERQAVRALCGVIGSDTHALHNLRVGKAVKALGGDPATWNRQWLEAGLTALEPSIAACSKGFALGETPTLADVYLVPMAYSAQRFGVDVAAYPAAHAAVQRALAHPAFIAAHPDNQPDAVTE